MKPIQNILLLILITLVSCVKAPPQPIVLPKPLVHHLPRELTGSGQISRDLYRSFWVLPSNDENNIHLGIIPSADSISFSAKHGFRLRIHEEHSSWDIFSPAGVQWEIVKPFVIRPRLVRYFATVDYKMIQPSAHVQNNELLPWIAKGYRQAQWIGPPKMDAWNKKQQLSRYFLSLKDFQTEKDATDFCQKIKIQTKKTCTVIGRIELPLLGTGVLKAKNSNFEKSFTGIVELISKPNDTIEIHDVPTEVLTDKRKTLSIQEKIYILPNSQNQYSLVEALPLEHYLIGVVASEIFPNAPIEALKAQAVIARTYTLSQLWSKYSLEPFYTCVTTQCQAYHGKKKKMPSVQKAVFETKNEILRDDLNTFTKTFYHASSGGKTDDPQIIFGGPKTSYPGGTNDFLNNGFLNMKDEKTVQSVIQSKNETYCSITRFSKGGPSWSREFSKEKLIEIFKSPVTQIQVQQRGLSGRVVKIQVTTNTKKESFSNELVIRKLFGGLPSSLIYFAPSFDDQGQIQKLVIHGRGSGHGVGMSQLGAIGRADQGQNYQQILRAYYPNSNLSLILK